MGIIEKIADWWTKVWSDGEFIYEFISCANSDAFRKGIIYSHNELKNFEDLITIMNHYRFPFYRKMDGRCSTVPPFSSPTFRSHPFCQDVRWSHGVGVLWRSGPASVSHGPLHRRTHPSAGEVPWLWRLHWRRIRGEFFGWILLVIFDDLPIYSKKST